MQYISIKDNPKPSAMSALRQMFSESGMVSSMRVLSFLCVLTAIIIALFQVFTGRQTDHLIIGEFLAAGFASKAWQKRLEKPRNERHE